MDLNKVFLIGRLTQDPQSRTTPTGQTVCSFGLATNRVNKDPRTGEVKKMTEYHNIVLWRRLAEIASQYLRKGGLVLIEGRIQNRNWRDASGNQKTKTEIVGERIQLGPKTNSGARPATAATTTTATTTTEEEKEITSEEIPVIEEGTEEIDVKDIPF